MKKLEIKPFEIKAVDFNSETKEMLISGYASTFNNTDGKQMTWHPELRSHVIASDTVRKGAFSKTISENKRRIVFCQNHDMYNPKGKIIELVEDEIGLKFTIRISDAEPELKTKILEKIFEEFSIGFQTINSSWSEQADGTYIRELTEVKLWEISIVTIARDENARITDIKSLNFAENILDDLLKTEKSEQKKFQLLQLKSLFAGEPMESLDKEKPKEEVRNFNVSKFKFI
jgi:HK97 family phage prohead protease